MQNNLNSSYKPHKKASLSLRDAPSCRQTLASFVSPALGAHECQIRFALVTRPS